MKFVLRGVSLGPLSVSSTRPRSPRQKRSSCSTKYFWRDFEPSGSVVIGNGMSVDVIARKSKQLLLRAALPASSLSQPPRPLVPPLLRGGARPRSLQKRRPQLTFTRQLELRSMSRARTRRADATRVLFSQSHAQDATLGSRIPTLNHESRPNWHATATYTVHTRHDSTRATRRRIRCAARKSQTRDMS